MEGQERKEKTKVVVEVACCALIIESPVRNRGCKTARVSIGNSGFDSQHVALKLRK